MLNADTSARFAQILTDQRDPLIKRWAALAARGMRGWTTEAELTALVDFVAFSRFVDELALFTFESFAQAREEVIDGRRVGRGAAGAHRHVDAVRRLRRHLAVPVLPPG